MNQKQLKYAALMLFFTFINPSFAMDYKISDKNVFLWKVGSAMIVGDAIRASINSLCSLVIKGEIVASQYENVSSATQEWARNVLNESGIKNIDKILFKKGKDGESWKVVGDHFVVVPNYFDPIACSYQERLQHEFSLKHEVKHFQNYDGTKRNICIVGSMVLGLLLAKENPSMIRPFAYISYGANMAYWKYQEKEADRFACEKARSKEEIEVGKKLFENVGANFKQKMLAEKMISNFPLKRLIEGLVDSAFFIYDREHPSWKSRAAMAQDYINKWDREHPGDEKRA